MVLITLVPDVEEDRQDPLEISTSSTKMALQAGSCECSKNALNLFEVSPTMTAMEESTTVDYHPLAPLEGDNPIQFEIPADIDHFIDFGETYLELKVKVLKPTGENLDDASTTGPVNNFLHSMFKNVSLELNGKRITSNTNTYPYRAYIETLLGLQQEAKDTYIERGNLWLKDTADEMDNADAKAGSNDGLKKRRGFITLSKVVHLMGRLHLDLWQQGKYLLNGVKVNLRLDRAAPTFSLLGAGKIQLTDAILLVRKVRVSERITNDINARINTTPAKYNVRRVEVKSFIIHAGTLSKTEDHVITGQLPKRVIVGFVSNAAFNGTADTNPFNFQHFDLNRIDLKIGGQGLYSRPLKPDFAKEEYLREYMNLYQGLGQNSGLEQLCEIGYEDFATGYAFFPFDFTPDLDSNADVDHPIKYGNIRIELQFSTALPATVNVILYCEYDNAISFFENVFVISVFIDATFLRTGQVQSTQSVSPELFFVTVLVFVLFPPGLK